MANHIESCKQCIEQCKLVIATGTLCVDSMSDAACTQYVNDCRKGIAVAVACADACKKHIQECGDKKCIDACKACVEKCQAYIAGCEETERQCAVPLNRRCFEIGERGIVLSKECIEACKKCIADVCPL